jgi:hypothetical protein
MIFDLEPNADIFDQEWSAHYGTREEAIAEALEGLSPGDSVVIHKADCTAYLGKCTCSPEVIVLPSEDQPQ